MRKFSGITNINSPEAISPDKTKADQMIVIIGKDECDPGRIGMNIQPYRTEFRNIYK